MAKRWGKNFLLVAVVVAVAYVMFLCSKLLVVLRQNEQGEVDDPNT
jgi:hypothetical protein